MGNPELSEFQIALIQLNMIGYRLSWANHIFEKTLKKIPKFQSKEYRKTPEHKINEAILLIMFEHIILNLDQLFEAHPTIVKKIREEGFETLEKALNKLWKPIQNKEKKIQKWRNQYVAHSKKRVSKYITTQDIDKDYFETQKQIFRLSRLGTFYISGIFHNFPFDYKNAMKIHQQTVEKLKPSHIHDRWDEMIKDTDKIVLESEIDLKKAGYDAVYPLDFENMLDGDKELESKIRRIFS